VSLVFTGHVDVDWGAERGAQTRATE